VRESWPLGDSFQLTNAGMDLLSRCESSNG
jgi:hypothetical protein